MRYDTEHRGRTRTKILQEAAAAIRAKGPDGVGVAALMKRAGLTHGGFYAHFESKEALVAEAVALMFEQVAGRFDRKLAESDPRAALADYVDFYLSESHRDGRDRGCPIAALSTDMARLNPAARERFGQGVARLTMGLAGALERHGEPDAEAAGASMLAELVGSLSLSRAVADAEQSSAILDHSKAALRARYRLEQSR